MTDEPDGPYLPTPLRLLLVAVVFVVTMAAYPLGAVVCGLLRKLRRCATRHPPRRVV